jgi:hypothetical protein
MHVTRIFPIVLISCRVSLTQQQILVQVVALLATTCHPHDNLFLGTVLQLHPSYTSFRNKIGALACIELSC